MARSQLPIRSIVDVTPFFLSRRIVGVNAQAQIPRVVTPDDLELQEVDLSNWDCRDKPEGLVKTPDGKERNPQKNRRPVDLTGMNIPSFDIPAFLARVAACDRQLGVEHRRDLNAAQKIELFGLEKQIVSLTGWLVFAYPSWPPETANCKSDQIRDWHLELRAAPASRPARGRSDRSYLRDHATDGGVDVSKRNSDAGAGCIRQAAGQFDAGHEWTKGPPDSRDRLSALGRRAQWRERHRRRNRRI